jgi:hypothetical protein
VFLKSRSVSVFGIASESTLMKLRHKSASRNAMQEQLTVQPKRLYSDGKRTLFYQLTKGIEEKGS